MRNKITSGLIVLTSIILLFPSCEENETKNNDSLVINEAENYFDDEKKNAQEKAQEYGLSASNIEDVDYYKYNSDSSTILIAGLRNDKLFTSCFSTETKDEIMSWKHIENLDTTIIVNLGYGETESKRIGYYSVEDFECNSDTLILLLWSRHIENSSFGRIITSDLYSIKNNSWSKEETLTYPDTALFYYSIKKWTQNSFLVLLTNANNEETYSCYNYGTKKLFDFHKSTSPNSADYVIDMFRYILYQQNSFICTNTLDGTKSWTSDDIVKDLPSDAKTEMELISDSDTYLDFNFSYILYDGTQDSIRIKLQKETGEIKNE